MKIMEIDDSGQNALISSVVDNVGYPKNGKVQKFKGRLLQKKHKKSTTLLITGDFLNMLLTI